MICFGVSQCDKLAVPTRGVRPGCATADYLFNVVFTRPLQMVEEGLRDKGMVLTFGHDEVLVSDILKPTDILELITDVTFVDDAMLPMIVPNSEVLNYIGKAMDILHMVVVSHCMGPNYGKGKTGVLVQLRGQGREQLSHVLYGEAGLQLKSARYGFQFSVERQCKHMETWCHSMRRCGQRLTEGCNNTNMRWDPCVGLYSRDVECDFNQ
eukprot:8000874-Pyramimonas_sp.AAC.1